MTTIVVCGLGGTIAMTATPGGGAAPALSAGDLVSAVPGAAALGLDLALVDVANVPSASLRPADIVALSRLINDLLAGGADGVVVTQGTDTLEECAYLLDLLHDRPEPVVVTGSMRPALVAGADGPANLLAALTVAADPGARGRGVLVAFADDIHTAARVRKTHTTSVAAFVSATGGPVGQVVEGRARFVGAGGHRVVLPRPAGDLLPRVPLVVAALGADAPDRDLAADGLVVAALGAGHLPHWWAEPLAELADRMPVVLASRTLAGPVLTGTYSYPGSERDLIGRALIPAGFLDPAKARILLLAVLAGGGDRQRVAAAFAEAAGVAAPAGR
ncbi:asparaginase [Actinoplanes auranticolor]|uniref:L-asparaginase n=1 Tax=Actinoplanes auranticolor TaxID=47988 RepID=A0A919SSG8_9ACTN|nr:asparaginase [Actinoplanes auranticolor]GIM77114.1 L-asparaginase [Actinoplanes auranticolor]